MKIMVYSYLGALKGLTHPYYPLDQADVEIFGRYPHSYSDLNGDYWIWKNLQDEDIVGKMQYRKWFGFGNILFPEEYYRELLKKADICFGYPIILEDTIYNHFALHSKNNLDKVLEIIGDIYGKNCAEKLEIYFKFETLLIGCNIYVAKTAIIREYYEWLFPILERVDKEIDVSGMDEYQQRLPGYVAERLLGAFFTVVKPAVKTYVKNNFLEAEKDTDKKIRFPGTW
ncbi:MAG: DUF4422 domain-containing protein [Fibromonadaceae bacterium]|nr:DUF4422 domain-containing protein [Fibromonadaceae bacterium]